MYRIMYYLKHSLAFILLPSHLPPKCIPTVETPDASPQVFLSLDSLCKMSLSHRSDASGVQERHS